MGQWIGMVAGSSLFTIRNGGEIQMIPSLDPLAGGIQRLEMASNETGWAQASSGTCTAPGECQVENLLLRTLDGGSTWQPLALPQPPAGLAPAAPPTSIGQGFDKCEVADISQYQAWWQYGPYRSVNLYIGGSSRGCPNSVLNANLVTQLGLQGWNFIPTWVGPQAPCTSFSSQMSSDPDTAYTQGVAEANSAADVSSALGLKGGVIYYDLEAYPSNPACRVAVSSFMNGWTAQLHARSHISALYGSSCASYLKDMTTIANIPDGIWLANWIYDGYNSAADVWDVSCVSNNYWSQHQRIRQYNGAHTETWGGVAMTIDSNAVDGIVADANNLPASICPTLGGVILYRDGSYSCSNLTEGSGFVLRGSAGVQNLPNTFLGQASSVHAPVGWSVMLYEQTNRGGGKKCINSPGDDNFVGDTFDNGAVINDRVASFEVFTTTDCAPGAGPDTVAPLGDYDAPTDDVTVSIESSSTSYVQPGTVFDPSVVVRVTT
ncbi:MAG: DUF1906 domain-containing protein, partial [Chloroflexi bacterium]|nr:DUF1906 domain-containing protein [Chloroflexota bacterium]